MPTTANERTDGVCLKHRWDGSMDHTCPCCTIKKLRTAIQEAIGLTSELYDGPKTYKGMHTLYNVQKANKTLRDAIWNLKERDDGSGN